MSCSGPKASASPPDMGLQWARPALLLRSLRLSGGLFRMSRSEPRLTSSVLFCDWTERSSGLFHTPSLICLCETSTVERGRSETATERENKQTVWFNTDKIFLS